MAKSIGVNADSIEVNAKFCEYLEGGDGSLRILVVESHLQESQTLAERLMRCGGHDVTTVQSGAAALDSFQDSELILIHLEMPDIDGLEVCRRMRTAANTPIIMISSSDTAIERILGLQAGADDCLEKPYQFRELLARIEAVTRRSKPYDAPNNQTSGQPLQVGELSIDMLSREVTVKGDSILLTRKEFDLLHYLASNQGAVVKRQEIMTEIWRAPKTHALSSQISRTIDTHVSSLRSKLGNSKWIVTVRGVGFRLERL